MSSLRSIAEWRPRTPFFYGWLVLGTAALGAFAAAGVTQVVLGGIQSLIFEDMGWDRSTIAYGVTIGTWGSGLLTPLFGRLADRHGPRGLMPVGLVVVGVSLFGLAGIRAVWHFYVAYIIARSIANPILIGVVPRTAVVNFFQRRRNLALGLQSMARPVAGAINIQVISLIARGYSWRVAYRALGVFALVLIVPLFLVMRRRPEDIGLRPDGDRMPLSASRLEGPSTGAGEPAHSGETSDWGPREAIATSTFWLIVAAESLVILTSGAIGFQIVPYLMDSGLSQTLAAVGLSLSSLLGALGNPGWGHLADRLSARRLALFIMVATAVVTSFFLVIDSGRIGFLLVVVWGITSGGLVILSNMMLAHYFGRSNFGTISGLAGPFQLGFLGLGPTFGTVLFSLTDGYMALFGYAVFAYCAAAVLVYSLQPPRLPAGAEAAGIE